MKRAIFWFLTPCRVIKIYLRPSESLIHFCKKRHSIPEDTTFDMLELKKTSFTVTTHDRTLTITTSSSTRTQKGKNRKEFHHHKNKTRRRKIRRQDHNHKVFHIQNTELNRQKQENVHHGVKSTHKPPVKKHICIYKKSMVR
jgi:hypothetical protein